MFTKGLTLYIRVTQRMCWSFDYTWGEANHFVHDNNPDYPDGTPLNKDYSIELMFLWFYIGVSYNIPLPYKDTDDND